MVRGFDKRIIKLETVPSPSGQDITEMTFSNFKRLFKPEQPTSSAGDRRYAKENKPLADVEQQEKVPLWDAVRLYKKRTTLSKDELVKVLIAEYPNHLIAEIMDAVGFYTS